MNVDKGAARDAVKKSGNQWSNAAALLCMGAAGASVIAPPMALVLGMGSGVAWLLGNRYHELADDPPRSDIREVTLHDGTPWASAYMPRHAYDAELERTFGDLINLQSSLYSALGCLQLSLERYQGATDDFNAALLQANAIRHNLAACHDLHAALLRLAPRLNARYWSHEPVFHRGLAVVGGPREWVARLAELINDFGPEASIDFHLLDAGIKPRELFGEDFHKQVFSDFDEEELRTRLVPSVIFTPAWYETLESLIELLSREHLAPMDGMEPLVREAKQAMEFINPEDPFVSAVLKRFGGVIEKKPARDIKVERKTH